MAKNTESDKSLVIVESPAKAKTIEKFLGSDFIVTSSYGHIRDLKKNEMSIDIENGFIPNYEVSPDKLKTVKELKSLAKSSKLVWLATDEDREGEAIAWHLAEALELKDEDTRRIVFHEITKNAILKAINEPRKINKNIVDAQQARRVLDRLVGYELSPVLWRKVKPGLSAGRVQSVAVRLIVEREREVNEFGMEFSYKTTAEFLLEGGKKLNAELKKRFQTEKEAQSFLESILNSNFTVEDIVTKPGKKTPAPPFTTSTLQQEASRKLSFSVKQTMVVAQKLYEQGFITYMRTDSLNLSELAIEQAESAINSKFGAKYHKARRYKTDNASAQEAHEAIRPTDMSRESISADRNMSRLYELIWKRAVASQMSDAELERTTATIGISGSKEVFTATGEVIVFDGFLKLYLESKDEDEEDEENSKLLPPIKKGQLLDLESIVSRQLFKSAPPRYTEASLVRKLEEMGIGRPSTYAPTISTIQDREYVEKTDMPAKKRDIINLVLQNNSISRKVLQENYGSEKAKLVPTSIGIVVNDFLVKFFPDIVDYNFTAKVEEEFDQIAHGRMIWNSMISNFYKSFSDTVKESGQISRKDAVQANLLGKDPASGKNVYARIGRYGPMLQIGETEDEEKPVFAPMPKNKSIETINLDEALQMFKLPREIGLAPDGSKLTANIGRFGPYVKHGSIFASIKEDEIFSITPEEAWQRVQDKINKKSESIIKEFPDDVKILKGRFGPYITNGKVNARIPKGKEPASLTFEECVELIAQSEAKKPTKSSKNSIPAIKEFSGGIKVLTGRYGAYITDGKVNAKIPKGKQPEELTEDECKDLIKQAQIKTPAKKAPAKKTAKKK